jgi:NAD+ synthase
MADKGMSQDDIQKATQIDMDKIEKIHQLYKKSEHKRTLPSRYEVSEK